MKLPRIDIDERISSTKLWGVECRAESHVWVRIQTKPTKVTRGIIREIYILRVCQRCSGARHDTYELPTFELLKRWYSMGENYHVKSPKGSPRLTKRNFLASILESDIRESLETS